MIEAMLEAERALAVGLLDQAERLYSSVIRTDPRNSIAIVGLARVALERGDELGSYLHARQALTIDPDNPMASHLVHRISEILAGRGETVPGGPPVPTPTPTAPAPEPKTALPESPVKSPPDSEGRERRGVLGRLLGRR
jgi:hypothetical protein